jgi:hypothetical protein
MPNGTVVCHHPRDDKPGSITTGADGQQWAFTKNTKDDRAAVFTLDKPLEGKQPRTRTHLRAVPSSGVSAAPVPSAALPLPQDFYLAPYVASDALDGGSWQEGQFWHYSSDYRQQRIKGPGKEKRIYAHLKRNGQWLKEGSPNCPCWNEGLIGSHQGTPVFAEGEPCAYALCQAGILGLSLPGHLAQNVGHCTSALKRLKQAGLELVAYLADNDEEGRKKAAVVASGAAAAGLPFVGVNAGDIWQDLPAGGSVDDLAHLGPNELIAQLDKAFRDALANEHSSRKASDAQQAPPQKRRFLEPGEVLDQLRATIGQPRLNVRTNGVEIEGRHTNPDEVRRFYLRLSERTAADGIKWERGSTADGIVELAAAEPFDPVLDAVLALTAGIEPLGDDQWQRLDQLLLGTDDGVAAAFLPKYLISAVARLFKPGAKVDQTLVLIGDQGIGKSRWGEALFGLEPGFVIDHLGSRLDKDDITRMHRAWAVELGELDGIVRRTDQEAFKAFLTRHTDVIRRPYGAADEELPRRTIFYGTSNGAPLKDLTGSRRFVCVGLPKSPLPIERLLEHRPALWARALVEYHKGEQWWSSQQEAELIREQNLDHQALDPWQETIGQFLFDRRYSHWVTLDEALGHLELPATARNSKEGNRVTQLIEANGWRKERRLIEGVQRRAFFNPTPPSF